MVSSVAKQVLTLMMSSLSTSGACAFGAVYKKVLPNPRPQRFIATFSFEGSCSFSYATFSSCPSSSQIL